MSCTLNRRDIVAYPIVVLIIKFIPTLTVHELKCFCALYVFVHLFFDFLGIVMTMFSPAVTTYRPHTKVVKSNAYEKILA